MAATKPATTKPRTTKSASKSAPKPATKAAAHKAATPKAATPKTAAHTTATPKVAAHKPAAKSSRGFGFPALDFSKLDLSKLSGFDWSKMSTIDPAQLADRFAGMDDKLVSAVRDAAYITVGFGVLAFQQAQVRRRELVSSLSDKFGASRTQVDDLLASFEAQLRKFDGSLDSFETTLDRKVEQVSARLPEQAASFVAQAHDAAKAARKQLRGLISTAA
jgi:hypothetical protein